MIFTNKSIHPFICIFFGFLRKYFPTTKKQFLNMWISIFGYFFLLGFEFFQLIGSYWMPLERRKNTKSIISVSKILSQSKTKLVHTTVIEETLESSLSESVDSDSFPDLCCAVNINCFPGLLLFLIKAKDNLEASDLGSFIKKVLLDLD